MGTKRKDRITVGVTALILFGFLTGNIAKVMIRFLSQSAENLHSFRK